jgi:hypothetical protein
MPSNDARVHDALIVSLSSPRLDPYLRRCGGDRTRALELYKENMLKAARLWPYVHMVEITLRNRTHQQMCHMLGHDWLLPERQLLMKKDLDRIEKARNRLENRLRRSATLDEIVAALSLGFWVGLYSKRYDAPLYSFWRKGLCRVFPGLAHKKVRKPLQNVRDIRNRIAHHDSILRFDEQKVKDKCVSIISWMCQDTGRWTKHLPRAL